MPARREKSPPARPPGWNSIDRWREWPVLTFEEKEELPRPHCNWAKVALKSSMIDHKMSETTDTAQAIENAEEIYVELRQWIDTYMAQTSTTRLGVLGWQYHWKMLRAWVPLQLRLVVEQVAYDKGLPWSRVVSGFKPL